MTNASRVIFTAPRTVELEEFTIGDPRPNQVQVETIATGISAGTEMNVYRGDSPQWRKHRDPETMLFTPTSEEDSDWKYPIQYGYLLVGRVTKVGAEVTDVKEGDLVSAPAPHQSAINLSPKILTVLKPTTDPRRGLLLANMNVALNGILDARLAYGETAVVSGLGVIGQMVAQLAARSGVGELFGVDAMASRRDLAARLTGLTALSPQDSVAETIREATANRGADVVLEVSGASQALGPAIRTAGYGARVIALSWYARPLEHLELGDEFHHNRIQLISSQAANVNPALGPLWSVPRRHQLAVSLLDQLDLDEFFTHDFAAENVAEAFDTVDSRPEGLMLATLDFGGLD